MKTRIIIIFAVFIATIIACEDVWQKQYYIQSDAVDKNMWEVIRMDGELSSFADMIEEFHLDTLFEGGNTYTLFIPNNAAVDEFSKSNEITDQILRYHFINQFIQSQAIKGKRKLQTITQKYALFENIGSSSLFDEIETSFESPLYLNGKYFILDSVATPKPSLFEYIAANCPSLKIYIESKDSIIIDKERSTPIGFDEFGNTIFDTVPIIYNSFEELFFPVREEFRSKTATLVFPRQEQYISGLDAMALDLGGNFTDHTSIPFEWEQNILIPFLLEQGTFSFMLEEDEFLRLTPLDTVRIKNILGDSIDVSYKPRNKVLCSNGYSYDYTDFTVPDSLYNGNSVYEGEWLLNQTGKNKFDWYKFVTVNSSIPFAPNQTYIATASNDTLISVNFPKDYNQNFSVEFLFSYLFPRDYRVIVSTHMDYGGIYNIYVNDELVKTFDYYDYVRYTRQGTTVLPSVTGLTSDRFINNGRLNKFDFYVSNITDYERVKIKFEYAGPSTVSNNGFYFDNIIFIPKQ